MQGVALALRVLHARSKPKGVLYLSLIKTVIVCNLLLRSAPGLGDALYLFEVAGDVVVRPDFLRTAEQRHGLVVPA